MLLTIIAIVAMIGLDQLSKYWAASTLASGGSIVVIPGILEFIYVENRGAAFSMFTGRQGILIGVTSIALLVIAYIIFVKKPAKKLEYISLVLIFAGGVGNLIDRIMNQYVIDFFNFLFMNFAVFNIADIYVTFGFAILIFSMIRDEIRNNKNKKLEADISSEDNNDSAN